MRESLLFLAQFVRSWRVTGSITPSSRALARATVDAAGAVAAGQVVVEFGPGTGVITRELMRRFPGARIVAVEANEAFASRLPTAVPGVTVVNGCASRLGEHLAALGIAKADVAAVVSGLPLLSLPDDLPKKILAATAEVLSPGRRYAQYTYSGRAWRGAEVLGFRRDGVRRVWWNVPPAVVLAFTREG